MTLLLAPFWTFGKEKSKDQAKIEKDEQKAPELQLPICYFASEVVPESWPTFVKERCRIVLNTLSGELIFLPYNDEDPFYPDELQQKNNAIGDDEFINHLDQLGILNRAGAAGVQICGNPSKSP